MLKEMYVKMAAIEETHWWFTSRTKIVENFIKKLNRKNLEILDLGCASGKNFEMLSKYGTVTGFEPEDYSIQIAKSKNIAKNIIKGFMPQDEKLITQKFDLIVLTDVLEHIENDKETLNVLYRLLNPGGIMIVTVPALMWLWSHHDETHFHFRRYTTQELKKKITDAGFKSKYVSYFNFFLFPIIAAVRTVKNKIPKLRKTDDLSDEPSPILNKLLGGIFSSERFVLGKIKFPIGVSVIAFATKEE